MSFRNGGLVKSGIDAKPPPPRELKGVGLVGDTIQIQGYEADEECVAWQGGAGSRRAGRGGPRRGAV